MTKDHWAYETMKTYDGNPEVMEASLEDIHRGPGKWFVTATATSWTNSVDPSINKLRVVWEAIPYNGESEDDARRVLTELVTNHPFSDPLRAFMTFLLYRPGEDGFHLYDSVEVKWEWEIAEPLTIKPDEALKNKEHIMIVRDEYSIPRDVITVVPRTEIEEFFGRVEQRMTLQLQKGQQ